MTFSPFLTVLISKGIIEFYKTVLKREGFQVQWGKLSDGIWKKNKGDSNKGLFYTWYTTNLISLPIFTIGMLYIIIEKTAC
ncbi:hypothetical protein M0D21_02395 [Aquimarina sp. D1M17]|uniref:hypothetical protein n=1 Tax=Aquimarina acroporae TaxID=2937283 RepID=UPI0020BE3974|nr:hypothetical protein [Aquimarina acroporae]MCK8520397.1 hypothetical protein [Aquimarina acroporae]